MLSYQHEYHAGNHGDLIKHVCLSAILDYLCKKEKPYTVIDTHSSAGRFFLDDQRLKKTGEANDGIYKLFNKTGSESNIPDVVKKYLDIEHPYLKNGIYAGSPEIEKHFLRKGDVCHLIEKHPEAFSSLEKNVPLPLMTADGESKVLGKCVIHNGDSYSTTAAIVPPLVKRGLVICDPSYEDRSDYRQVSDLLKTVHKKWNTAIIALWYPILDRKKSETAQMLCELEDFAKLGLNPCETINIPLTIHDEDSLAGKYSDEGKAHMLGSGMFIMNPPWTLKESMEEASKFLAKVLKSEF